MTIFSASKAHTIICGKFFPGAGKRLPILLYEEAHQVVFYIAIFYIYHYLRHVWKR